MDLTAPLVQGGEDAPKVSLGDAGTHPTRLSNKSNTSDADVQLLVGSLQLVFLHSTKQNSRFLKKKSHFLWPLVHPHMLTPTLTAPSTEAAIILHR